MKSSNQTVTIATTSPVPINLETVQLIIVYGGVSVCTILAMTVFCHVLLSKLNEKHSESKEKKGQVLRSLLNFLRLSD